jgi:hypothetical protein
MGKDKDFSKQFRKDAQAWAKAGQPPDQLYSGEALDQARRYARKGALKKSEWAFLEAGLVQTVRQSLIDEMLKPELRGALNNIIGFSKVMMKGLDGPTTDRQAQDLQAVHDSGQAILDHLQGMEMRYNPPAEKKSRRKKAAPPDPAPEAKPQVRTGRRKKAAPTDPAPEAKARG